MLSRPEIGSREHILLWLASKPEDKMFLWRHKDICACGQYSFDCTGNALAWIDYMNTKAIDDLNVAGYGLAVARSRSTNNRVERQEPVRFGDLYREMRDRVWATENP